uniref:receptor-like cytosolic serine/threonine-protein kinase RBK2 isoform X1 n=1 Tax=Fragaria vesca subsp. vesca TaxID=101020 RepID=UPI0005C98EC6|nr:PREDICTED: receptor-like cytosolic serine/threonine-protein kinase RBK2 isoform X1 [Fragaria vesca subsp. vesca]XP_011462671.1 PREDICTED: receptor-like cytosolic serine/threonine-protein kinase RBK2 isoform X1 [Fragaria vesca subsp. vesca]
MVIASVPALQFITSGFAAFVSKHNGSRDVPKENQEGQAAPTTPAPAVPYSPAPSPGTRRSRAGFSDSFSTHDLNSLNLEETVIDDCSPRQFQVNDCPTILESEASSPKASTSELDGRGGVSDLEGKLNSPFRGFFRMLRKGPQTFPQMKNAAKPKLTRRKSKRIREDFIPQLNTPGLRPSLDTELHCFKSSWKNYSLSELEAATNKFDIENLIGEGGYAEVYKGTLEDGQFVAIKRLIRGNPEEMTADFLSELGVIVHVDHPNIAKVIGYGVEGGMHLVLDLSPHGSLSSILYGPREILNWGIRYKVALGTAKGLVYLHEGCQRRIIHKDIKASNILLAEDFEPQISDFGLAKWLPDQWTHHIVSKFEGTFGYLPPEFFMHGIVDEKTDVYAYGVLILELITGRQALDSSHKSLVMWAKPLLMKNNIKELADPSLADGYDVEQMKCLASIASLCVQQSSVNRPQMRQIVQILEGDQESLDLVKKRQKSKKLQRTYSEELLDADEYNSTKYLTDMDKHLEFILGPSTEV